MRNNTNGVKKKKLDSKFRLTNLKQSVMGVVSLELNHNPTIN